MNVFDRMVRLWHYRKAYTKEKTWIVTNEMRLIPLVSSGKYAEVKFNWRMVYTVWDNENGFAGFYHLHPPGIGKPKPSQTDIETLQAWSSTFGWALGCWIDNGWGVADYIIGNGKVDKGGWIFRDFTFDTGELRL